MRLGSRRATLTMIVPAVFALILACGTPPPSATAVPTAPTGSATPSVSVTPVPAAPGSEPASQNATETPVETFTPVSTMTLEPASGPTPKPTLERTATADPTATAPPSSTENPTELSTALPTDKPAGTPVPTAEPTPEPRQTPKPPADPPAVQADIVEFILPDLNITVGATVVWINLDEAGHTVTLGQDGRSASTGGTGWDSGGLDVGESFNQTFPQAGIFPYACRFHPWMNATVTVGP